MKCATNPKRTPASGAPKKSPPSLSQKEWDFSKVPETELDACFYYEFARASDVIKNGIASWRADVPNLAEIKIAWLNAPTSTWLPGTTRHVDDAEFERYFEASRRHEEANALKPNALAKTDGCILDLVASFKEYPVVCWQMLPNTALKAAHAKNFKVPDARDVAQKSDLCLTDLTMHLIVRHLEGLSAWGMIQRAMQDESNASIKPDLRLFGLSWNYRNDELVAAFRAWLEKNRPPQYPEPDQTKKKIGVAWQTLPLGKRTALEYLGVYRRKQTCTWPEFVKRWPESPEKMLYRVKRAYEATQGQPENAANESRISQLKGQSGKAKEIISIIEG